MKTPPLTILLHSSKTMRSPTSRPQRPLRQPQLLDKAVDVAAYVATLSIAQLAKIMHISPTLAQRTQATFAAWNTKTAQQAPAIDSFVGDIYSGLQADSLSSADRDYADTTLRILSGLYGILRPYDGIMPYRLEMGYKFPDKPFTNLYAFWGDAIAACLPASGLVVNVSSVEYTSAVLPYIDSARVVTPQFLTVDPKTGDPVFTVVHAKIARGAFARWLITSRTTKLHDLRQFNDIGYKFDAARSTPQSPVFVCHEFGGKGLSMRLR